MLSDQPRRPEPTAVVARRRRGPLRRGEGKQVIVARNQQVQSSPRRAHRTASATSDSDRPNSRHLRAHGASWLRLRRVFPADHHLGCLDDRGRLLAAPESELVDRVARDDRRELLIADPEPNLREEPFAPHLLHDAAQPVPAAQRHEDAAAPPPAATRRGCAAAGQQAGDLLVGDAVVPAVRPGGADAPLVDPLLEGGVGDAEAPAASRTVRSAIVLPLLVWPRRTASVAIRLVSQVACAAPFGHLLVLLQPQALQVHRGVVAIEDPSPRRRRCRAG